MARERSPRCEEILGSIVDFGISEERATREGVENNSLPASGKFAKFDPGKHLAGEGNFKHVRIGVENGNDTISTSALQIMAPKKGMPIVFKEITREDSELKGKKFLSGTAVNPSLSKYSIAELVEYLEGKSFTAKKIEVKQLPYKDGGWDNPTEEDLVTKEVFEVTVK